MGIRARLILLIVGVTTIVNLAWGVTVVNGEALMLRRDAQEHGLEMLRTLAVSCAVALERHDTAPLEPVLAAFGGTAAEGELSNVAIVNDQALVLVHSGAGRAGAVATDPFTTDALASAGPLVMEVRDVKGRRLHLSMPLEAASGTRLATATAEVDLSYVEARIWTMKRRIVLGSALMSALGAVALSVLISGTVLRPLEGFSKTALMVSRGDLTARVAESHRADEVGLLARVFNEMVHALQGQTERLEAEVSRRTEQLRAANGAYEQANADLARAVAELERLASTDGLTGLVNHRSFQEALAFELRRARRTETPLSLLMIDVDHFKAYNDHNGHPAGDQVLIQLARIFRDTLRDIDVVARYGGEEFAVLLLDTSAESAAMVAQKVRDAVRSYPFPHAEQSQPGGRVTVSIGLANVPRDAETGTQLVSMADQALYVAKRLGRDQVASSRAASG
jgi:diguanylate cyclase (GGDEF)-like protein